MAGIRAENIRKIFGTYEALKSVSLEVADREFTVLLGPSGCGKTTLLRIIAGLETQTSGEIRIGDRNVSGLPPRRRGIAMVFQNYAVFPHLTVFENVAFGLRMKRATADEIDRKVRRAAAMMHIEQLLERYPSQLSGGQRQRVAVARALAVEPEVLLMDEPLSNLDALLRMEMRAELKGLLQETRTTTIYVTHDQVEAMSLADRIAVMHGGRIVQYDRPIRVYQDPATAFCGGFIGSPPMNFIRTQPVEGGGYRIGGAAFPGPAAPAGEILFGIRPEDLIVEPESGPGLIDAEVGVVEPLGPHLLLTVRIDGQPARVTAAPDLDIRVGETIHLRPGPGRIRWFDPATDQAIREPA